VGKGVLKVPSGTVVTGIAEGGAGVGRRVVPVETTQGNDPGHSSPTPALSLQTVSGPVVSPTDLAGIASVSAGPGILSRSQQAATGVLSTGASFAPRDRPFFSLVSRASRPTQKVSTKKWPSFFSE